MPQRPTGPTSIAGWAGTTAEATPCAHQHLSLARAYAVRRLERVAVLFSYIGKRSFVLRCFQSSQLMPQAKPSAALSAVLSISAGVPRSRNVHPMCSYTWWTQCRCRSGRIFSHGIVFQCLPAHGLLTSLQFCTKPREFVADRV